MDIIFLGLMFCEESLQDEYKAMRRKTSMAPHKFQTNMISGLENQPNVNLSVISVPPTGSFPINHKELCSKSYNWGKNNRQIGYINLPKIKHMLQFNELYRQVKKRISNSEPTYLLVYSLYEPFLRVAKRIKGEYSDVHICLIHTDAVPGRNDMEKYMTKQAKKRGDKAIELTKNVDSYILLTKYLADSLEVGNRPYTVIECICDDKQQPAKKDDISPKSFLYTGSINKAYGICELVEAFKNIPDAQLWICGDGDARDTVVDAATRYPNITYYGFVSQEIISELQDKCSFLINPRRPSGTYTMYSFPSKTAEYLMTGKPVVMYKLEGIPDEYDDYILYLSATVVDELVDELCDILLQDYDQMLIRADNARKYMVRNKSSGITAERIISFLNAVMK